MSGHTGLLSAPQLLPFVLAALGGLVYAAAPGPLNITTIQRTVERGFLAGACVQLGALVGQGSYALLAASGVGIVATSASIQVALGIGATALLGYLGWSALHEGVAALVRPGQRGGHAATDARSRLDDSTAESGRRGGLGRCLRTGAAISFANPYIFGFWLSVGTSTLHRYRGSEALYLSGFFLSVLVWGVVLPALVSFLRPVRNAGNGGNGRILSCISVVSGLLLLGFGLKLGISLLPTGLDLADALHRMAVVAHA